MVRMLQVALLCLLLGSAHPFTVSRNIPDETEEAPVNSTSTEDDYSVSALLQKANKNLVKRRSGPALRELDIAVGYGLQNADPCTAKGCKWNKAKDGKVYVPYRLSNQYSRREKTFIENDLKTFSSSTCIRFIPQTKEKDYLDIMSDDGCYSYVGKQGGPQTVSLDRQGCLDRSTVQHELLHALGFEHEQCRSDRDKHVKILLENVLDEDKHNFDKIDTNNLNSPYDYGSVMHYGRDYFSKNGKPTIVPIPDPSVDIGKATEMSANDLLRINRLYNCKEELERMMKVEGKNQE